MSEKVSIIIPTYNRSDIIGETLNSVMAQTYTNWECIVVDDGSNDNTEQVLEAFIQKDTKFQYHKRPDNKPKGANACRNYGLELSKGAYVNWFDSDDLMMPNFLQAKVNYCIENNCDFVFSNTNNFNQNGIEKPMFHVNFDKYEISADNFIQQKIVWSTLDFLCKKESIKDLKFNEELKSGQEYNFFSRYLIKTINGKHLDKVLAKRRVHESSIQEHQKNNKTQYRINKYNVYFKTYLDVKKEANKSSLKYLLQLAMSKAFEMARNFEKIPSFFKLLNGVIKQFGLLKAIVFLTSIKLSYIFKTGYSLMEYSRK